MVESVRTSNCEAVRQCLMPVFGVLFWMGVLMSARREKAGRKVGAYLCLLATVLLYAPLAALACNVSSMTCCDGDRCPLHRHHQRDTHKHDMDSGHDSDEMTDCSMDCCHTSEKAALTMLTFVLPRLEIEAHTSILACAITILVSDEIRLAHEPLAPPPRFGAVAL